MSLVQPHYEINVTKRDSDGVQRHFFATDGRSCVSYHQMQAVYRVLLRKFPTREGYTVEVTQVNCNGITLSDPLAVV